MPAASLAFGIISLLSGPLVAAFIMVILKYPWQRAPYASIRYVCLVVELISAVLAIAFASLGLHKNRGDEQKSGKAIAGILLGGLSILASILVVDAMGLFR